jgi:hypothetical protein
MKMEETVYTWHVGEHMEVELSKKIIPKLFQIYIKLSLN